MSKKELETSVKELTESYIAARLVGNAEEAEAIKEAVVKMIEANEKWANTECILAEFARASQAIDNAMAIISGAKGTLLRGLCKEF